MINTYAPIILKYTKVYTRPIDATCWEFVKAEIAYDIRTRVRNNGVTVDIHKSKEDQYWSYKLIMSFPFPSVDFRGARKYFLSSWLFKNNNNNKIKNESY